MSSFLNVSVLVLATMVLVLAGMVGYLYWQQNKLLRSMTSLSSFVASQFTPPLEPEPEPEPEPQAEAEEEVEDDRVSVEKVEAEVEVPTDVDDLQTKTAVELRELLTKKGIPYGKRDSKTVLLELLKASS
jgi:hypothetical protein